MTEVLSNVKYFVSHPIVRYYTGHPIILLKNRIFVVLLWLKKMVNRDVNFDDKICSDIPIDVVIVTAEKDYETLPFVVESIRHNVKHPIENIVVISPKTETIIKLCKSIKCVFVDEDTVLPITRKDINYTVTGIDRSGWLFQQLLKWSGDKYVKSEYFLIADADTIFCRPQVFIYQGKTILSVNDRLCHIPYFEIYKKLLGKEVRPLLNLTSHHLLFQKSKLKRLKEEIKEHCGIDWYKAIIKEIDKKEGSSVSDYETYGQSVYLNYPREYILEHWFNKSLTRENLDDVNSLIKGNSKSFKSLSFHSYKK